MKIFGNLFLVSIIFFTNCNTTEPPPADDRKLTLTFEDASCIEAWINITTENIQLPAAINIFINDSLSQISILNTKDSLLYIDSLLPNQTYKLLASSIQHPISSNELTVTTMDTTSHNFTFETWTFGDIGSSVLYDVAIIDENNIWAVGEINIADTSVNGYTTYNAVHWDGNEWTLHRIMFYTFCPDGTGSGSYPARAVFALDNETIVVSSGSQVAYLKNGVQVSRECIPVSVNKLWGTDKNNLYAVGVFGQIGWYNGSQWTRIESGTTLNINDVWGDYNEMKGEWEILAVGGNILHGTESERVILKIKDNQSQQLNAEGTRWPLISTWFKSYRNEPYPIL